MKKSLPLALLASMLACVMLACVLVACTQETNDPQDSTEVNTQAPTQDSTQSETDAPGEESSEESSEGASEETSEQSSEEVTTEGITEEGTVETAPEESSDQETAEETTEEVTEEVTTEETTQPDEPESKAVIADFNLVDADDLRSFLTGPNQVNVAVETDEDGEQYVSLSTKIANATDPYVEFSFKKFYRAAGIGAVDAKNYKYVVLKVRNVNCSTGTFEMFFYAGKTSGVTVGMNTTSSFDLDNHDWQYVLFDLTSFEGWTGKVNGFRFDYMTSAIEAGETLHIAEIQFLESDSEFYKLFDIDWTEIGVNASEQAKAEAEQLLGSVSMPATKYDTYTPETAENEDASLSLWFDHLYNRTPQQSNTPNGKVSYQIQMAKNEIEGCQLLLGSENGAEGLKVYVSDFTNEAGNTLTTQLHWGYYFNVEGERIIDPLPPVSYEPDAFMIDWISGNNGAYNQETGEKQTRPLLQKYDGFDIKAGENQTFVIKATTTLDSVPGEYSATVTVVDQNGNEVKKATVFAYVWNFELPEATSCKTLMSLSAFDTYVSYYDYAGKLINDQGKGLPQIYYDYLLENRVCAYDLPFGNEDGSFSAEGIVEYLDNPRVVAFQPLGFSKELTAENTARAYEFLSQKQEWLDKAYFYPVDEPLTVSRLNDIRYYGQLLTENFPGYQLIVPMHVNYNVSGGDYFSYVADYVNVWCPKTFFYNTFAEWFNDRSLTYGCSIITEQKLGSFRDRMWAEQAGGDELWWYVTRRPADPEITLIIDTESVNLRTLFWQQKLYNIDGFLYYLVNDWTNGTSKWYVPSADEFYFGMDALHEISAENNVDVYGNGILLYSGAYFAQIDPVGSLRLECVRDGIEDFEYLTILEEKYGKDVVDAIINQWTTGVGEYSTDTEQFRELREKLGALVEAAVNE